MKATPPPDACVACAAHSSRRDFLRDTAATVIALLAALGAGESDAAALPIRSSRGRHGDDSDVRYPLPPSDSVTIDKPNEVILVRWQNAVYAFALSCPHQRTMLRWLEKDSRFQCPKHKSKYQPNGTFISGRATRGMDRHPVRVEAGTVIVNTTETLREDENALAWAKAKADRLIP